MGLLEEQAARNIANGIAIEKSMGKDINDESCLDMLEKAGRAAVKDSMKDDAKKIVEGDKEAKRSELARQLEELDEKLFEHEKRRGDYDRQADWARDKKEMQDKFDKLQAEHHKLMGRGWGMRS